MKAKRPGKRATKTKSRKPEPAEALSHFRLWLREEQAAGRLVGCICLGCRPGMDCSVCRGTGIANIHEMWPRIVEYVEQHTRPIRISDIFMESM
jgi:hypothetical protein